MNNNDTKQEKEDANQEQKTHLSPWVKAKEQQAAAFCLATNNESVNEFKQ